MDEEERSDTFSVHNAPVLDDDDDTLSSRGNLVADASRRRETLSPRGDQHTRDSYAFLHSRGENTSGRIKRKDFRA